MRFLLIVALASALCGCAAPGYIRAEAIDGTLRGLIKRHEAYTVADDSLSPLQRSANMRDGVLIKKALDAAKQEVDKEEK